MSDLIDELEAAKANEDYDAVARIKRELAQGPETAVSAPPETASEDGTVADVLAWVGDDTDRAVKALDAEEASENPRVTLIADLKARFNFEQV